MTSIIRGNDNFDTADVPQEIQGAKAWVNFNGTGTVAIVAQYNVSSITDRGVGTFAANFTNAMADANYIINGTSQNTATGAGNRQIDLAGDDTQSTTSSEFRCTTGGSATEYDSPQNLVVFHGN